MSQISGETRTELIERVVAHVLSKMPKDDAPLVGTFVRQYYMSASAEDLVRRSLVDLYGAVVSYWQYLNQRKPGQSKVRVYNPQFEQHGWQSTHTVIEIAHDDMPFLVDSVRMELNRRNITIHLVMHLGGMRLKRDRDGRITEILESEAEGPDILREAPIFLEIDKQSDPEILEDIATGIQSVLKDVRESVRDWHAMREVLSKTIEDIRTDPSFKGRSDVPETLAFLEWVRDNNFTFLAYAAYTLHGEGNALEIVVDPDSTLGVARSNAYHKTRNLQELPPLAQHQALSQQVLMIGKTSTVSRVHRPVYTDFVSIKRFNAKGRVTGEHRFIGLYTSAAYNRTPLEIPLLREKVMQIFQRSGLIQNSHDGKTLLNIIETLPRDDLFQAGVEELFEIAIGILHLQERQKVKLFIRRDMYGRYFSCLVFVPRDRFSSDLRLRMQEIIRVSLRGKEVTFTTRFSESVLARIHFIVRVDPLETIDYDVRTIEDRLVEASRTWQDHLMAALVDLYGEEQGIRLYHKYSDAFTLSYRDDFIARTAAFDIQYMESLTPERTLAMSFYRPLEEKNLRFKLFQPNDSIPLSDIIPMLECMGLRVIGERPYEVRSRNGNVIWINDFSMVHQGGVELNTDDVKEIFQDAFYNIWHNRAENDGFNQLVLGAALNWREITILRAYAKYLWQIGFTFSQSYIDRTLAKNPKIAKNLVRLFHWRFDPALEAEDRAMHIAGLLKDIDKELELVQNLDEDRIMRRYIDAILATLRTNFYQFEPNNPKDYIAFKFNPKAIPDIPKPVPLYEIFVYSPRVEGIHLRAAKVARGGIRWSDRREDFRTEVLGLVKAQQVKNSVIVPMGAKGGFVIKKPPQSGGREDFLNEGIRCYQTFISGLLDLTDNLKDKQVVPPEKVVRYDEDDPYLVVAADKGTATFSDIANKIALARNFWLGDAFASGGSAGYDHKKMGITAKGAWESVKRHFREIGIDTQKEDFTVVGIGDMSGDVFGNGMLLSPHIKLLAAFDHRHIFIDPNPDPQKSFEERQRLFNLPRSSWTDYSENLISEGGGVFPRTLKSIKLTKPMQALLETEKETLVPNELIKLILKMSADLLWNGGIGTYVKASSEHHGEVGDRANDGVRINANELRVKVVGEGGNLGFTQLGRVEYALSGGRNNTDAIDNSGGVDCSDHEVNIKIFTNHLVEIGDLTEKIRNQLLVEMTEEVADLVIANNRAQTEALSVAVSQSNANVEMHARLITELERAGKLDRDIEFLPSAEEMLKRKQLGKGLTRPELAVLMAYVKNDLKQVIIASDLPEDPYFRRFLMSAFPSRLTKQFSEALLNHHLRREIIATQFGNCVINEMSINFIQRLLDETGASVGDILKGYAIARAVFDVAQLRQEIAAVDAKVLGSTQVKMIQEVNRLARRGARWFIRHRHVALGIQHSIEYFQEGVKTVSAVIRQHLRGIASQSMEAFAEELLAEGVPAELSYKMACMSAMFSALDIVEAANTHQFSIDEVTATYFTVGLKLKLGWFREQIKQHPVQDHWDSLARAALRDDLDRQQRTLTIEVLKVAQHEPDVEKRVELWVAQHKPLIERWLRITQELRSAPKREFIMLSVALRELLELSQASSI